MRMNAIEQAFLLIGAYPRSSAAEEMRLRCQA
jgi:hypothetical protein